MCKGYDRLFIGKEKKMAHTCMKKCLISLIIREMVIKIGFFLPVRLTSKSIKRRFDNMLCW